jgi:hypothetical protein
MPEMVPDRGVIGRQRFRGSRTLSACAPNAPSATAAASASAATSKQNLAFIRDITRGRRAPKRQQFAPTKAAAIRLRALQLSNILKKISALVGCCFYKNNATAPVKIEGTARTMLPARGNRRITTGGTRSGRESVVASL